MLKILRSIRRACYKGGRVLGDVNALASGKPDKIVRRILNKQLGKHIARRTFFKGRR